MWEAPIFLFLGKKEMPSRRPTMLPVGLPSVAEMSGGGGENSHQSRKRKLLEGGKAGEKPSPGCRGRFGKETALEK